MIMRAITATNDWQFGNGQQSYTTGQTAIVENINTRLKSFLGDCFFDLTAGIDWFRLMGSKATSQELTLSVRAVILSSYGVLRITSLNVNFNSVSRNVIISYSIDTIFTKNFVQNLEIINA